MKVVRIIAIHYKLDSSFRHHRAVFHLFCIDQCFYIFPLCGGQAESEKEQMAYKREHLNLFHLSMRRNRGPFGHVFGKA